MDSYVLPLPLALTLSQRPRPMHWQHGLLLPCALLALPASHSPLGRSWSAVAGGPPDSSRRLSSTGRLLVVHTSSPPIAIDTAGLRAECVASDDGNDVLVVRLRVVANFVQRALIGPH